MQNYHTFADFTKAQDHGYIARSPLRALEVATQMGPIDFTVNPRALNCTRLFIYRDACSLSFSHSLVYVLCLYMCVCVYTEFVEI